MASFDEHRRQAPACVRCIVLTVSDTRTAETDASGQLIIGLLEERGHRVAGYRIVKDMPSEIERTVLEAVRSGAADAILLNGGTGISARDGTYEAISRILEKRIDGFGEVLRMLSFQEIGPAAVLSRAVAGVVGDCIVASMPGSSGAVRLAMEKIIIPEIAHMVFEIRKQKEPSPDFTASPTVCDKQ